MNKNQKLPEGWKDVKLGEVGTTFTGLSGKTKEDFGSGSPFITYMNIYSSNKIVPEKMELVKICENENQNFVKYGDIFFTTSSETPDEVGISSVLLFEPKEKTYLNSFCFGFRLNDFKTLLPEFSAYFFRGNAIRKMMSKLAQGATRFNLSKNEFLKNGITVPADISEQRAIAGTLGIWDAGIEKLSQLIKLKEKQKKAIMQKILTGKTRLKGFSKPWKTVKLGEICEIKKGKQLGRLEMLENGSVPVMNGGIMPSGFTDSFNENENTITISEGGNSCGFVSLLKEKFWCGGHCYALKNLKVEILFLFQILKQKEQEIMRLRVGSGLPNIQKTVIEKFSFYVPADIDEQCAIAGTLSVCDEELALLNKKLALLREQKKSLMQQLLTGKMRLKF